MNTQALFCLSLPLVIAGCAQQTSTSTARDSAFAQSLRPPVFSDIYQRSPEVTRSGRYTLVSVKSADAQREPLNQLIDITMPGQLVNSVGDGFRYLLFQSGYRVPASTGVPEEAERADSFPLLPTPVASEGEGAANDDGPDDPDDNVVALPWAARRGKNNPHIQRFVSLFNQTAPDANRWQVFSDFVHMAACSLYNAIHRDETFEADYRQRVARYSTEDAHNMSRLLAEVIEGLEFCPTDFLGQIFMNLELGNTRHGQYFTPYNVCYTMSRMTLSDRLSVLTSGERDFITVSDPACGAGGMIVAMAEAMLEAGFNPQKQMMVYCVDIDPVAAMMCYIQLSLMGIPAIVATGNSLTVAIKREMATPMFVLGHWHHRWQAERTRQAA